MNILELLWQRALSPNSQLQRAVGTRYRFESSWLQLAAAGEAARSDWSALAAERVFVTVSEPAVSREPALMYRRTPSFRRRGDSAATWAAIEPRSRAAEARLNLEEFYELGWPDAD